jgi:hypothetical protein
MGGALGSGMVVEVEGLMSRQGGSVRGEGPV